MKYKIYLNTQGNCHLIYKGRQFYLLDIYVTEDTTASQIRKIISFLNQEVRVEAYTSMFGSHTDQASHNAHAHFMTDSIDKLIKNVANLKGDDLSLCGGNEYASIFEDDLERIEI